MNKKYYIVISFILIILSLTVYWCYFPEQNPFIKVETINLEPGTKIRYLIYKEDYIKNTTSTQNADICINDINSTYISYSITYMNYTDNRSYFFSNPGLYGVPLVIAPNLNVGDEINYMNLTINRTEIRIDFLSRKLCINVIENIFSANESASIGTIHSLIYYEKSSGLCLYTYTRFNYTEYDAYGNLLDRRDYFSYDKIDYIS